MNVIVLLTDSPGGEILDPGAPHFSGLAQGIGRGDGIFETALYARGKVNKLDEHLWRLKRSADLLDLEIPTDGAWERAVATAIEAWCAGSQENPESQEAEGTQEGHIPGEAMVKLSVIRGYAPENPGGYAWVSVTPMPEARRPQHPITATLLEGGIDSAVSARAPWLLLGAKTLSYATNMAALREAHRRGADDAIFTTTDGYVLEAPTATVFIKRGDQLITPHSDIGVLPGTTQRVLFRAAEDAGWATSHEWLTPDDLRSADGVWLSSSARLLTEVGHLDDDELKVDHDAHEALMELLWANL